MLFVRSELAEIVIRGDSRVGIARLASGQRGEQVPVRRKKQQTDGRPGAGYRPPGEEIEQSGNDVAHATDIGTVIGDRALVAHAPQQLEIQRDDERAVLHCETSSAAASEKQ